MAAEAPSTAQVVTSEVIADDRGTTKVTAPPGQTVVVEQERHCGIISILIGICFFPCGALICLCPVDQKTKVVTKHG